ncbi:NAD-dependent epimerase/dehydratase family protein [Dactylosporangium sp. NPDC000521]|uniref:NAD-dependent epimerase/dehydratase family protein n=1 Tax=Dactylosporangium sp. NPDC000521 TaxID=3363975 RepID=UPI0036A585B3
MTAVVLGAAGGIGSHLVEALTAAGRDVRAVSRAPLPGGGAVADLRDPAQVRAAVAGATVVFHAAQPAYTRWPQEFPALTETIADATAAAGARLVLVDNLYMYGPATAPMTESLPYAATDPKGRTRAVMATALLDRHRAGTLDVVIGRACDYYGPRGVGSVAGETLFGPALTGAPARLLGALDQPHTWSYLPDVAAALIRLADAPQAGGRAWHLPAAEPLTQRELVTLVYRAAGHQPRMSVLPGPLHRLTGAFHPMLRELYSTRWQFTGPFTVDWGAYAREIGPFTPTPHSSAIRATLRWYANRAG